ncbi:MAG: hypothetical protein ABJZ55_14430 [Fuerstiella sp.]
MLQIAALQFAALQIAALLKTALLKTPLCSERRFAQNGASNVMPVANWLCQ